MKRFIAIFTILSIAGLLWFMNPRTARAAVSDWQKGATFQPGGTEDFGSESFKATVLKLKMAGVDTLILVIPYYQPDAGSHDLQPGWNTPSDQSLTAASDYIHSYHMRVVYNIHADIQNGEWRADINPADRNAWFARYGEILDHYANLAASHGVEGMVIGTELMNMTDQSNPDNTQHWRDIIGHLRTVYHGFLTYGMQWDGENVGFLGDLDYVGVGAYVPVGTHEDASTDEMKQSWSEWNTNRIKTLADTYHKPILFTEAGYKSVWGSNVTPWMSWRDGAWDEDVQAIAYEALFSYWNDNPSIQGIYLWDFKTDPNAGGQGNTDYTPQNKRAEDVMRRWFGSTPMPSCGNTCVN